MKFILAGIETVLLEAWGDRFHEMDNVEIFRGSIFDTDAGNHTLTWDGSSVASGIYILRLDSGKATMSRKAALVR